MTVLSRCVQGSELMIDAVEGAPGSYGVRGEFTVVSD